MQRKPLGQVLLKMGAIDEAQLATAINHLRTLPGRRLGEYLCGEGTISEQDLARALAIQFELPFAAADQVEVDRPTARLISQEYARGQKVLPLHKHQGRLVVAVVDPLNIYTLDDLGFVAGMPTHAVVVTDSSLQTLIRHAFSDEPYVPKAPTDFERSTQAAPGPAPRGPFPSPERGAAQPGTAGPGFGHPAGAEVAAGLARAPVTPGRAPAAARPVEDDSAVTQLTDEILRGAVDQGASDVHIEPLTDSLSVRYRVDGVLRVVRRLDRSLHPGILSRIKILGGADISERRIPQDGRFQTDIMDRVVDVRLSTLPTIHGEKAVLRLLDKTQGIPSFAALGMNSDVLKQVHGLLGRNYGMILSCGPTGAGKTTTIISALQELNRPEVNVITIEDPVEYELPGVNHVAVNPKAGLTFASGLRSMLRQDPDVIFVGEIRDVETAKIATRAALTGHLLLSTLHTNDSASAISRLVDMEVEGFLVASAMVGVMAQRLVRCLCSRCKRRSSLAPDDPYRFALGLPPGPLEVFRPQGCEACGDTGYKGRIGLYEVLVVNDTIRSIIVRGGSTQEIKDAARAEGMKLLVEDGVEKVLQGLTSPEEVLRVTVAE